MSTARPSCMPLRAYSHKGSMPLSPDSKAWCWRKPRNPRVGQRDQTWNWRDSNREELKFNLGKSVLPSNSTEELKPNLDKSVLQTTDIPPGSRFDHEAASVSSCDEKIDTGRPLEITDLYSSLRGLHLYSEQESLEDAGDLWCNECGNPFKETITGCTRSSRRAEHSRVAVRSRLVSRNSNAEKIMLMKSANPKPGLFRTQPCHYWNGDPKSCPYGGKCWFIHGDMDDIASSQITLRYQAAQQLLRKQCGLIQQTLGRNL